MNLLSATLGPKHLKLLEAHSDNAVIRTLGNALANHQILVAIALVVDISTVVSQTTRQAFDGLS